MKTNTTKLETRANVTSTTETAVERKIRTKVRRRNRVKGALLNYLMIAYFLIYAIVYPIRIDMLNFGNLTNVEKVKELLTFFGLSIPFVVIFFNSIVRDSKNSKKRKGNK